MSFSHLTIRTPAPATRLLMASILGAATLTLAACGSSVKLDDKQGSGPAPIVSAGPGSSSANGVNNGGVPSSSVAPVVVGNDNKLGANGSANGAGASGSAGDLARVIYFDFDSFVVKEEFRGAIDGQAKRLSAAKSQRVVIEGHTDERGGREYNLALGQKRAEAVQKSLTLLGVSGEQIESVSFGEERPAAQGSNEEAWAKNRRAELKDR